MVNLELLTKVEEYDEFVRIYMTSGDVEEIDVKTFRSAIIASGTQYMKYEKQPEVVNDFNALDNSDIEDVTDLSDGNLVAEEALAPANQNNAVVEGSDVTDEEDAVSPEEIAYVLRLLRENKITLS